MDTNEKGLMAMEWKVCDTYEQMCETVALELAARLAEKPESLISLAAGNTSLGVFDALARLFREHKVDFSRSFFAAMDEWKGMSEAVPGSCSDFLKRNFLSKVNFAPSRVRLIRGDAADPAQECAEVKTFIESKGGIDFLLLGAGMNGHLALNEPKVDFSLSVHGTELDQVTKEVGKKYFNGLSPALTGGVTIGIADIRKARRVVLSVSGAHKREILKRIVSEPVSNLLPASVIKELPDSLLICDREAAAGIGDEQEKHGFLPA